MKSVRRPFLPGCQASLHGLSCVFVLGLASCSSLKERTAQRVPYSPSIAAKAVQSQAGPKSEAVATETQRAVSQYSESSLTDLPAPAESRFEEQDPSRPADVTKPGRSKARSDRSLRMVSAEQDADLPSPDAVNPDDSADIPVPAPRRTREQDESKDASESSSSRKGEVTLNGAPLEEGDLAYPINLASAMRLSDARPLVVAEAQAKAWVAEAQLQRAQVIWVPTLNMGGDYVRHDGYGPDFNRALNTEQRPLSQNVNFLYAGAGATASFGLTDAIYEPLAARQVLNARRMDIQAAKNDALLDTAKAYFEVHRYRGQYAGALDSVKRARQLEDRIRFLSEDLVPRVEHDRVNRMLATAEQHAVAKREEWRIASANLTQVLRLDPRVVVDPAEQDHLQITLIDPSRPLDELIPIALCNRPELSSHQSLVAGVAERIRREKGRILMPSIMLNGFQTPNEYIQVGAQGFGADKNLNLWSARNDISPQVLWQWEALGIGNLARIKEQRGEQSRAIIELFKQQDKVAADVTRAQARVQSAAVRVLQAERAMSEAIITFEGNYEGLAQTKRFDNVLVQVFRPQEAVNALDMLVHAYDAYFATVAEYNRSQFEMYHALGYPALDAANANPPGDVLPVDTSRPHFLPPVESGPPAATR